MLKRIKKELFNDENCKVLAPLMANTLLELKLYK